jgi:hypothetical protein
LYWKWWRWDETDEDKKLVSSLRKELGKYYKWCATLSSTTGYNSERINEHKRLVDEYFRDEREWDEK